MSALLRAVLVLLIRQWDVMIGAGAALAGVALKFSVADAMIAGGLGLLTFAIFGGRITKWGS